MLKIISNSLKKLEKNGPLKNNKIFFLANNVNTMLYINLTKIIVKELM